MEIDTDWEALAAASLPQLLNRSLMTPSPASPTADSAPSLVPAPRGPIGRANTCEVLLLHVVSQILAAPLLHQKGTSTVIFS